MTAEDTLRARTVAALLGSTAAGSRVEDSPAAVPSVDLLGDGPRLYVMTPDTSGERAGHSPIYDEDVTVRVVGHVIAATGAAACAAAGSLAQEIGEALLGTDWLADDVVRYRRSTGSEDGEVLVGWCQWDLTVTVRTEWTRQDLGPIEGVDAETLPEAPIPAGPSWSLELEVAP